MSPTEIVGLVCVALVAVILLVFAADYLRRVLAGGPNGRITAERCPSCGRRRWLSG